MKDITISLLVGLTIGWLASCAGGGRATTEISPGSRIAESRCATCHRPPDPRQAPESGWELFLASHAGRAGLDEQQTRQLLVYLSQGQKR